MVEQDPAGAEDAVGLAIVDRHPVGVQLGYAVWTAGIERRGFHLGNGLNLAEHLGCRGLIETDLRIDDANGLKKVYCTDAGNFRSSKWLLERNANEALRGEIVDFSGLCRLQ
ncbi:hypothetical protein D9M70_575630 [compost metagenome]